MHEIRATLPPEQVAAVTRLARQAGIDRVSVADVYVHGPDQKRQVISVETSTPKARAFVDALLGSADIRGADYSITSRELRAIVNGDDVGALTKPMSEPFPDVIQDLWQLSHLTISYVARAAAGALLLATAIIDNNAVSLSRPCFCPSSPKCSRSASGFGAGTADCCCGACEPLP
jgi:hypothetical protein